MPFGAWLLLLAGSAQAAQGTGAPGDAAVDELVSAVAARVALADAVARSKWQTHQAIEDAPRERLVIASASAEGQAVGLDATQLQAFFADQITASKIVQYALHAQWASGETRVPADAPPDLAGTIRPELDHLQHRLIAALAASRVQRALPECTTAIARSALERANALKMDAVARAALDYALAHACVGP